MILLLIAISLGIICGYNFNIIIPDNLITILLMFLVFSVGIDIGSEEGILKKIKINLKVIIIQTILTIGGTLIFGSMVSLFTSLSFKEALGASSGLGWYSLSGVMISNLYSPVLGAISFTSNVIREILSILLIPIISNFTYLGSISIAGATSMDTMLGIISKNTDKESTLIGFGQGVLITLSVPMLISIIFN
ncbi:lysine exporter LysO family protein [Oceanotoga sp. DSM 15011]|jgi:uncharacterized membrane protein YbjE (DUF340 family)|uniref:Lysine exporter LysO-like protein n=1 Tax=Oceanotoga teriensis TaxID=515440 RepID=A0AA45HJM8_9BACT|nr:MULTISPECIES: lysine exporter LysO family protein [Oceanotoga]MDN5343758.1 hypothetical protein [Oceanotoga sp.]MDO7975549.1 lysine exporter LysO family protein [Oceanotoga teriensis]PWJ96163.1 lysine exporter LysO-like protein [Oceanotoga teriensis]UYO99946.1 lysine exporter LysO family protein [Oceanotoga sp. DSM 15011]